MAITIGSNISSIQAQRRLGESSSALASIYERLSSGQRINRASDDAAGLAIAEDLNAKGRIFAQAIRNGNDGLSALAIADSAVESQSGIVTRVRELAEQSANGTYSSKQRSAIDIEAQALRAEFLRITQTTSFNGIKLFDGTLGSGLRLQLGVGPEGFISAGVGGNIGTGELDGALSISSDGRYSNAAQLGDLNNDGILDLVTAGQSSGNTGVATVQLGIGNGMFGAATSFSTQPTYSTSLSLADLDNDGNLDLITGGAGAGGQVSVRLGLGNGSFGNITSYAAEQLQTLAVALGDLNGDGILDLVSTGQQTVVAGRAVIRLGRGDGTFGAATSFLTDSGTQGTTALTLGDINNDGILDLVTAGRTTGGPRVSSRLGVGDGTFGTVTTYVAQTSFIFGVQLADLNGDGNLDLVSAGQSVSGGATVRLGTGTGLFGSATSYATEDNTSRALELADLNGDGVIDLVTAGIGADSQGYTTLRLGVGNGTFGVAKSYLTDTTYSRALDIRDIDGDGVLDVITAGQSGGSSGTVTMRLGSTKDGLGPLLNFSLKTISDSRQAMGMLDCALENLSEQQGIIGSYQSRLRAALSTIFSARENYLAAESRIRDADIALESGNLTRTQILQQAAVAVLSQANQQPALALKLL